MVKSFILLKNQKNFSSEILFFCDYCTLGYLIVLDFDLFKCNFCDRKFKRGKQ